MDTAGWAKPSGDGLFMAEAADSKIVALPAIVDLDALDFVRDGLIEAVELGATAHFKVEGEWDDDLMTQVQAPSPIA